MADFGPPPPDLDIFHLNVGLTYIANGVYANQSDRNIVIANQDSQQEQLSKFAARLDSVDSAISSSSAQLSENIAAVGAAATANFDSLAAAASALDASLNAKIDTLNANLTNLFTLLEALIQALQGVATVVLQNQEIDLLGVLIQATSPEKAASLRLDTDSGVTTPQPIPAKPGP